MKRDPKVKSTRSIHSGVADMNAYVQRIVDAAPQLTPAQLQRLALLWRGAGASK